MSPNDEVSKNKSTVKNNTKAPSTYLGLFFGLKQDSANNPPQQPPVVNIKPGSTTVMSRIKNFFAYDPLVEVGISDSSSYASSDMGSMDIYEPIIYVGMPEEGLPGHLMAILNEKKKLNELLSKKRKLREEKESPDQKNNPVSQIKDLRIVIENEEKRKKLQMKSPKNSVYMENDTAVKSQKQQAIDIIKEKLLDFELKIKNNTRDDDDQHEESIVLADIIEKINLITPMPDELFNKPVPDSKNVDQVENEKGNDANARQEPDKYKRMSVPSKKTRVKRIILSAEEKKLKLIRDLEMCEDTLEQELVMIETNIRDMEDGLYVSKISKDHDSSLSDGRFTKPANSQEQSRVADKPQIKSLGLFQIKEDNKVETNFFDNIDHTKNYFDNTVIPQIKTDIDFKNIENECIEKKREPKNTKSVESNCYDNK